MLRIDRPFRAGVDRDAFLARDLKQLGGIDRIRQLHPEEDAALGGLELGSRPEARSQRLGQHVELALEHLAELRDMIVEAAVAVLRHDHLLDGARARIGLQGKQAAHDRPARDDIAKAQRGRDRLRERADMDHAIVACDAAQGLRALTAPHEVRIALVLEDRHAIALTKLDQRVTAIEREDRCRRILDGRDRVDILRADTLGFEVGEDLAERIDIDAMIVQRRLDNVHAELLHAGDRATVRGLLHDDRVALVEQHLIDEVEPLQRSGRDQDIVDRAGDTGVLGELLDQEFAQRQIALRTAFEPIGSERRCLALQHLARGGDEVIHRNAARIVVAADKVVLGKAVVLDGSRRQVGTEQRIVVDHAGASSVCDFWNRWFW